MGQGCGLAQWGDLGMRSGLGFKEQSEGRVKVCEGRVVCEACVRDISVESREEGDEGETL